MKKPLFLLCSTALILQLASCRSTVPVTATPGASTPNTPLAELRNTRWVLRSLNNRAIVTPANGEAYILLRNQELRAEGNAGCNRFGGTFTLTKPGELEFGPLMSTRMACLSDQDNTTEQGFLAALKATRTYQISGDTLRLYAPASPTPAAVLHAVYLH
ncbi:META domain-containing protein [Hymenobacter cellulosilyticus]|uniref:META domain-containing protein n=1 Tax=Hymenobacter cellulosilyticus TaxID=2932248 RepID=A0A8T9Q5D7_9BACT|nr:META domain-containing protein [Hymenobacter cellulosilyticus]UOQ70313.1 META domain-containing protein [Hymenobacter cellulosilyticus]